MINVIATFTSHLYNYNLQVLDKVTLCLRERFLENDDLEIYKDIETVILSSDPPNEDDTNIPVVPTSAISERMPDINVAALEMELNLIRTCKVNGTMEKFVSFSGMRSVLLAKPKEVRLLFPETMKIGNLLTVVPASSATAERSFSCLRRLKTWLRSTTSQSRLNSLALLNAHRDYTPSMETVLGEFIALNELRQRIFGP